MMIRKPSYNAFCKQEEISPFTVDLVLSNAVFETFYKHWKRTHRMENDSSDLNTRIKQHEGVYKHKADSESQIVSIQKRFMNRPALKNTVNQKTVRVP